MKASVHGAGEPLRDGHPAVSLASGKRCVLCLIPTLVKEASVQKTGHQLLVSGHTGFCVPLLLKANIESQAHGFLLLLYVFRHQRWLCIFEICFPRCKI